VQEAEGELINPEQHRTRSACYWSRELRLPRRQCVL
jgi:hypothetical protein